MKMAKHRQMAKALVLSLGMLIMSGLASSYGWAETQYVELKPLQDVGGVQDFAVVYHIDGATALTTGLGIRIHYNSKAVSKVIFSGVFEKGLVVKDAKPKPDNADYDNNPETDRFVVLAWMDLDGRWPYEAQLPLTLATLSITSNKNGGTLRLAVSASSVPPGLSFKGGRL